MLYRVSLTCITLGVLLLAGSGGIASSDVPSPGATSQALDRMAAQGGGGTPCGPNGLVCSGQQVCCMTDPLPPAPARYVCISKKQTCGA